MSMVLFPYTFLKNIFIYLVASGLSFGMQDFFFFFFFVEHANSYLWHMESSSLTRNQTWATCIGVQSLSH